MLNWIKELSTSIEVFLWNKRERKYNKKMKKLYPDYEDNGYNCGSMKFIWGVRSADDLHSCQTANFYTMNDIDHTKSEANSIEELYTNFRLFVTGFKAIQIQ